MTCPSLRGHPGTGRRGRRQARRRRLRRNRERKTIEVVSGDLQNKADVGSAIARRWYDVEKVDAILGLGNSAVAIAVQGSSQEKNRVAITTAAGSTVLTGKSCAPIGIHWVCDTYAFLTPRSTAVQGHNGGRS
jgi:branched-chain amino acid transport system substrate-binding protein